MPSTFSNQNNYYTAHHRQQSSQSQSSLPDQVKTSRPQVQSPNRSLVYLPSTAYTQPGPLLTDDLSRSVSNNAVEFEDSPIDPRDFYRPYQDPHGDGSPRSLHQDAFRTSGFDDEPSQTRRRKSSAASAQSQESRRLRSARSSGTAQQLSIVTNTMPTSVPPKALNSRKASFRDLVARFDASPDDVPPMPSNAATLANSRKNSPVVYANPYQNSFHSPRKLSHDTHSSQRITVAPVQSRPMKPQKPLHESSQQQRPLFGELLASSIATNIAGYGIVNARRRSGSEGSPMHSPNPMFSSSSRATQEPLAVHGSQVWLENVPNAEASNNATFQHRRTNSDFSSTSTVSRIPRSTTSPLETQSVEPTQAQTNRMFGSRIPVSARRQSLTSESAASTSSSRATSKLDHHQPAPPARQGNKSTPPVNRVQKPTTGRRHQPPAHIQSPGKHARNINIPQAEKSPSLRANIIAPPPKISPPLRGSRQRLPVSSATTAASRARMAEKFQILAREQTDRRSGSHRTRPPELTDIDFNARRLKITQALTRSREGQGLRSDVSGGKRETNSRSHSVAPSISEAEEHYEAQARPPGVPALVVRSPTDDKDGDMFDTPDEEASAYTHTALRALGSQQTFAGEDDSPTLGQDDQDVQLNSADESADEGFKVHGHDPAPVVLKGASTIAHTPTDSEFEAVDPQQSASNLSLLTQITSMRDHVVNSSPSGLSHSEEYSLDRTDAESVQLFLRNTTYNMDEDEALAKGYRHFMAPPPMPQLPEAADAFRSSWTSSIAEQSGSSSEGEIIESSVGEESEGHEEAPEVTDRDSSSLPRPDHPELSYASIRNAAASDTYAIVNIVVQEQSPSGVVDQQLVDDIFHCILNELPQITESNTLDEHKIVELCLRELEDHNERVCGGEDNNELTHEPQEYVPAEDPQRCHEEDGARSSGAQSPKEDNEDPPPAPPKDLYPPPSFRAHKYKSSLDSAEDWADTSPSVGDWMQFALNRGSASGKPKESSPLAQETGLSQANKASDTDLPDEPFEDPSLRHELRPSRTASPPPRAPSHSPPLPPVDRMPSIEQTSLASLLSAQTALGEGPQVPRRVTSPSPVFDKQQSVQVQSVSAQPSSGHVQLEGDSPDQRRLKQRRHVLKELVDTEFSYERDLRVLCDIYKQTAMAALTEDDVKVMFGNVDGVQQFAKDFLTGLKQAAKPAYTMDRQDKVRQLTRTPTTASDHVSIRAEHSDLTDSEKDRLTRVGQSFIASLATMESVYKEYIRGRHAANQRLAQLQTLPGVREWLKECSENSSDITNAWSLDALLVKPIQRITKYPLLISQLLESTTAEHPDHSQLREAHAKVTEINIRINEVKKHTEMIDQVMNRKRKESDVRAGLTKAFGRRAEKLRQHVGINEMYDDGEYARLKMDYDNNGVHLLIVSKDCQGYIDSVRAWVVRMCELAAAAEAWLDVGHSNHPQAESKLRQLAMAVRGINSMALPDHTELVMRKVIQPMEKALVMMERFKTDPKGLLMKREKKILDYNQIKNRRDRGEKLDRKMTERMEQWEAINVEVKQRMRKLLSSTTALVQSCLATMIQLHMGWLAMVEQKFAAAMAIPLDGLEQLDLVKEWQEDFDYQHAFAMSLGVCNGTLLAEAMNLMSFLTPGSTLNGEDSPRQSSWNSGAKRSISMNSEVESGPWYSNGQRSSHSDYPPDGSSFGHNSARNRAASLASGRNPHTPDMSGRSIGLNLNMPNGGQFSRPGTSPGRSDESSTQAPRVSLDAPSPSLGAFGSASPARPGSASTFFSAAAGPSNYASQPVSGGSSIFSSAMPLSDSPEAERYPGAGTGEDEPLVLFTAASIYEFNIDRERQEGGIPYLTYVAGEIFDVVGERGELWLARNQDDPSRQVGWIWNKHLAKLAT